jgi:ABC-type branched-subunit amino acid transport system substrate-binding protein
VNIASGDQQKYDSADLAFGVTTPLDTSLKALKSDGVKVVVLDTIPAYTRYFLDKAKALGYKATFVVSGVGSDPQTVNDKNEVGAISMTFLPATDDTKNVWNAWTSKVLLADKADFPKFTKSSILTVTSSTVPVGP